MNGFVCHRRRSANTKRSSYDIVFQKIKEADYCNIFALECLEYKIADYSAIVEYHTRTECVENTRDSNLNRFLLHISLKKKEVFMSFVSWHARSQSFIRTIAHGFGNSFRFVIACSRPDRIHLHSNSARKQTLSIEVILEIIQRTNVSPICLFLRMLFRIAIDFGRRTK